MKRLVLAALLLASCATATRQPAVQSPSQTDPEPPTWVSAFAKAFCQMNRTSMDPHLSTDLQQTQTPVDWPCVSVTRYLGYGTFTDGTIEYYFRFDFGDHTPAFGFLVGANTEIIDGID